MGKKSNFRAFSKRANILKQLSYVYLTFMSASSKCMNAFHSNFYITNCYHLETLWKRRIYSRDGSMEAAMGLRKQNVYSRYGHLHIQVKLFLF